AAAGCSMSRLVSFVFLFSSSVPIENVHPLQGGLLRRKYRRDRRPGVPIESIWSFYPKYAWDFMGEYSRALRLLLLLHFTNRRLQKDPKRYMYTDLAMTPVTDDETEKLDLFTHSDAARQAVAHAHKIEQLTGTHRTASAGVAIRRVSERIGPYVNNKYLLALLVALSVSAYTAEA